MFFHHRNPKPLDTFYVTVKDEPLLLTAFVTDTFGGEDPCCLVRTTKTGQTTSYSLVSHAMKEMARYHKENFGCVCIFDHCENPEYTASISSVLARSGFPAIEIHGAKVDPKEQYKNNALLIDIQFYPGLIGLRREFLYSFGKNLNPETRWDKCAIVRDHENDTYHGVIDQIDASLKRLDRKNVSGIFEHDQPELSGILQSRAEEMERRYVQVLIKPCAASFN